MKKSGQSKAELRHQAEKKLNNQKQGTQPESGADIQSLIHELEVHQIELEMQNEELAQAQAELEAAFRQYTDLYDFAPVGYFTLGNDGTILQANLAVANLLGVEHDELAHRRLGVFVSSESLAAFNAFFEKLLSGQGKGTCELAFEKKGDGPLWTRFEASCFEGGEVCRAMLTDLTARKRMASLLQARMRISEFVASHTFDELLQKTLDEAEKLTDSRVGFIHFLEADQKTLRLQMWSTNTQEVCTAGGKGEHVPVDQAGVWADCVSARAPLIHNDYGSLVHLTELPQGHASIVRELIVPVVRNDLVMMIMGVGNKPTDYNDYDVEIISQLANSAWDIAQRKQAEEALRQSQNMFSLFMHHSPIYAFIKEVTPTESRVLQASENYQQMIGISSRDMTGKTMAELFPPEFAQKMTADDWAVVANGKVLKLDEDLNGRHYTTIKFPIVQGDKILLAGYTIDITEQVQVKQALEAANTELKTALAREQQLARTDSLTGVSNRRYLYEFAEHEFGVATRYQKPLSVIMFDIDRFKKVNDTFGHMVGDQILELITQVARAELRSADMIGRYGGEEFIILLPMTTAQRAYSLAERIRVNVAALRIPTPKGDASITISVGIVEMRHASPAESVEDVFRRADEAMYAAKQAGRNRTEIGVSDPLKGI